jgi:hypothetical protein
VVEYKESYTVAYKVNEKECMLLNVIQKHEEDAEYVLRSSLARNMAIKGTLYIGGFVRSKVPFMSFWKFIQNKNNTITGKLG